MSDREAFRGARISNGPHKGPVSTLKALYRAWRDTDETPKKPVGAPERDDVYGRNKKHEKADPADHVDHDAYWTGAKGVFYCHTCEDWFRTWGEPNE